MFVADSIEDFVSVAAPFAAIPNFDTVLDFMASLDKNGSIHRDACLQVFDAVKKHETDSAFERLCCLIHRDMEYQIRESFKTEVDTAAWLSHIIVTAGAVLQEVFIQKKKKSIADAVTAVFGEIPAMKLANYSEALSTRLADRQLGSFKYVIPLNYLSAFLKSVPAHHLRLFSEVMTIKSMTNVSDALKGLFDSSHELDEVARRLVDFDVSLAPENQPGYGLDKVLKSHLMPDAVRMGAVRDVDLSNATAFGIIRDADNSIYEAIQILQQLYTDSEKMHGDIVVNWKEIGMQLETNAHAYIGAVLQNAKDFQHLIEMFIPFQHNTVKAEVKQAAPPVYDTVAAN